MTVLSAASRASLRLIGQPLTALFSNSETIALELADLANEVGHDIMKSHQWRSLTRIHTITGDSVETVFPLPEDYDRMLIGSSMHDETLWFWNYYGVRSVDEWIMWKNSKGNWAWPGAWIILEDAFHFMPAPSGSANYPYISKNFARSESGVKKPRFDNDNDTFVLEEDLLTLGLLWRWKAQKGLDYSEELESYEISLAQNSSADKGGRILRQPTRANLGSFAYPWRLGGGLP